MSQQHPAPEYGQRTSDDRIPVGTQRTTPVAQGVAHWTFKATDRRSGFSPSELVSILSRFADDAEVTITPNLRGRVVRVEVKAPRA